MRNKAIVIFTSLVITAFIMSSGYGLWEDKLRIETKIEVVDKLNNFMVNPLVEGPNPLTVTGEVYGDTVIEEVYGD